MRDQNVLLAVDTMIEIFGLMGAGSALGLQIKELTRRIHMVRQEIVWNADLALAASKMRAMAALYATGYVPDHGCDAIRAQNEVHLDKVCAAFIEFRAHIERQKHSRSSLIHKEPHPRSEMH